jgi:S1-C subfamily serine protease
VGKNEFRLNKKGIRVHDYESLKQFKNGYGYDSRDTAENFEALEKKDLYNGLSDILRNAEYGVDSSKAELDKALKLDCWVRSVVFATAEDELRCEARITWALETVDELQYLYDKSFQGNSEWYTFNEDSLSDKEQQVQIEKAFAEALDVSFKQFISMDTIQAILNAPVPIPLMEDLVIDLNTGNTFCSSVSEAVKSVVTVVSKNGHGSGCILTPDGYIITNAHVVEKDTTELEVIFGTDTKNRIPVKFVRMNEPVDLALLKLDTAGLRPLGLATSEQIETGADAYAIGTPADIDLGQSVTRGIISGKRKFGGHQMIQTDVAISPGNSGGALIRPDGVVMGIVTSSMDGKEINDIGFAIPAPLIESALKINLKN